MKKNSEMHHKMTKERKLKSIMSICEDLPLVTSLYEKEFEELIMAIVFIKKKSLIGFEGTNTLKTEDILKSLIKMTDINSEIEKDLRKTSLKILRKVIE
jgi:hypothetical protein